jgi:hypothetical protein
MNYRSEMVRLYKQGKVDEKALIKMASFEEMIKESFMDGAVAYLGDIKQLKNILIAMGVMGAVSLGTEGLKSLVQNMYSKYKNTQASKEALKNFESVYNSSPKLKKYKKELAQKYFNTLYHFSPKMASDPVSTESWLLQALRWEDTETGVPVDLYEAAGKINKSTQTSDSYYGPNMSFTGNSDKLKKMWEGYLNSIEGDNLRWQNPEAWK